MPKITFQSVDEYIEQQPAPAQPILRRVRKIICKAIPRAEEVISYNMPTFELDGVAVLYLAGWKQHYSLYPASTALALALGDQLAPYKFHKGTIRFPLDAPIPVKLIERIAKLRVRELRS
ncbi:MAG TPA: DUF1801 domain-containing protein [Polyangiales bacterium]|nr:DUF1801 domain-containing protein [Polyangiales bacterium]